MGSYKWGYTVIRLMDKILHYLKDPKLWELWYIPYYGSCRILSINRKSPNPGYKYSYPTYDPTYNHP